LVALATLGAKPSNPGAARPLQTGPSGSISEVAYFRFDYPPYPETFVFQATDPDLIQEVREILDGQRPNRHVMGTIAKQPVGYNPPWSYHLDPATVVLFDHAIEVCDASIGYVQAHLDQVCKAFLPGCVWCPWGSRLLEEVEPIATATPSSTPTATLTLTPIPSSTATATTTATPLPSFLYLPLVMRSTVHVGY